MLQPQIVTKPALIVVGLEAPFIHGLSLESTAATVIGPLWEKLMHRIDEIPCRANKEMYGIIYGLPRPERGHPDELQYIAGVSVASAEQIPQGMVVRTIPEGLFAVFTHKGPIHEISSTVRQIYRNWLPQSDYEHAEIADVEFYDQRFHCDEQKSEMDYWISIQPKQVNAPRVS